jgi:hypothetical protein
MDSSSCGASELGCVLSTGSAGVHETGAAGAEPREGNAAGKDAHCDGSQRHQTAGAMRRRCRAGKGQAPALRSSRSPPLGCNHVGSWSTCLKEYLLRTDILCVAMYKDCVLGRVLGIEISSVADKVRFLAFGLQERCAEEMRFSFSISFH